ncbi:MAG: hypothetical protein U1F68_20945 [Gammaproteobacteria bacterium]
MSIHQLFHRLDELNRAHAEAERLDALFSVQLQRAAEALLIADQDGVVVLPNARARALFQPITEQPVGSHLSDLVAKADGEKLERLLNDSERTPFAELRLAKDKERIGVFARVVAAFGGHRQAILLYWRTGKVPAAEKDRLLAEPSVPYQTSIPLDRRVIGSDLDRLQQKLKLNHQQMIDLLGVYPNKYFELRRKADEPIGDGAVARTVRLLDVFPDLAAGQYSTSFLREVLSGIFNRTVVLNELATLIGRDVSRLSRYADEDQSNRTVTRLTAYIGRLLETKPVEAFRFYEMLAMAEQRLREG